MSILRRIQQMRASLSGGSFLLEASGDLAAGDTLLIVKTSGAHQDLPEEVKAYKQPVSTEEVLSWRMRSWLCFMKGRW